MEEITVPEELILNTLTAALQHDLPDLITEINRQKKEEWLKPFASIIDGTREEEKQLRPQCLITIKRTVKKSQDPFVELGEHELELRALLKPGTPDYTVFRYASVLNRLFKTNLAFTQLYDRYVLEECVCYTGNNEAGPEGFFLIRIYRESLK